MSFIKSVTSSLTRKSRDTILKESLINNLSECVKEIQFNSQFEKNFHNVLGSSDSTDTLCMALEAIFLHGLKDTLLKKAKHALSGDLNHRPQPNFWPLVLVLSHRDTINDISSLTHIHTEIGQCRAWLRKAFNDCLLSSFMSVLLGNTSIVKPFYNKSAFVCSEMLELAQKLIEGLESCVQFNLPVNSSLLNKWPDQVLIWAGVWMPTIKEVPLCDGIDVASMLTDNVLNSKLTTAMADTNLVSGFGDMVTLNEEEALKIILNKNKPNLPYDSIEETPPEDLDETPSTSQTVPIQIQQIIEANEIISQTPSSLDIDDFVTPGDNELTEQCYKSGNSLTTKGWSAENEELNESINSNSSHGSSLIKTPEVKSLSSLVDNSHLDGENNPNMPNLRDIMKDIHKELKLNTDETPNIENIKTEVNTPEDPMLQGLDFEIIPNVTTSTFTTPQLTKLIQQLGVLSKELGLDNQDYKCKGCQNLLGSIVSKAKVCAYTGEYYCNDCMEPNVFIIPARVIHNWDFKRYHVSKRAALFLLEFQHHPWIDMKKFNPKIYTGVSDMAHLKDLRVQLNFLRAYIFTCREPVIEELQKRVWPREYLYDHLHTYTISDLAQIPNGSLMLQLEKVVQFAKSHVIDCWLCSQKGFICEVCQDPKILYPFETSTTYRCEECYSVFHAKCLNSSMPCPKCRRKLNRTQDTSLISSLHASFGNK